MSSCHKFPCNWSTGSNIPERFTLKKKHRAISAFYELNQTDYWVRSTKKQVHLWDLWALVKYNHNYHYATTSFFSVCVYSSLRKEIYTFSCAHKRFLNTVKKVSKQPILTCFLRKIAFFNGDNNHHRHHYHHIMRMLTWLESARRSGSSEMK